MFDEDDSETLEVVLIDSYQTNTMAYELFVYMDQQDQVYIGGTNHPTIGHSKGRTSEDFGKTFHMQKGILVMKTQFFENEKFVYR